LTIAAESIRQGESSADKVRATMRKVLQDAGIQRIDYAAAADPQTLDEYPTAIPPVILLIAAFVGQTRLIDNCLVE
jgi:pantothenate synthetase